MDLTKLNSVSYKVEGRIATITLNRPERLNAIGRYMPQEIRICVEEANRDDRVHVIVLSGAGRAFCAGYDLQAYAQTKGHKTTQRMPWDPTVDYKMMYGNTQDFSCLFHSQKPTIAKVRGFAVAGGSDIALSCDLVIMADDAKIGYMPFRLWGIATTAQWPFRLSPQWAKRLMFTGETITGKKAVEIGLITESVPEPELDAKVHALATHIAAVPKNQLLMSKLVVNSVVEKAGLKDAQVMSTFFDGVARHSPEGIYFKKRSEEVGFKQAVKERDSGDPIASEVEIPSFDRKLRSIL